MRHSLTNGVISTWGSAVSSENSSNVLGPFNLHQGVIEERHVSCAVCQQLFPTKTTLTVGCREMFGYGPMALMRRIRLQQVHELLGNPDLQQRLGCHTVQQAAAHFGFASRNHFASAYHDLFAETPRTTLLASR